MSENERKMIRGRKITIGDKEYIVPALNFEQLEEHEETIVLLRNMRESKEPFKDMQRGVPIVLAALQRNYPELTLGELRKQLDLVSWREAFEAVMGVSGLPDIGGPAGELRPARPIA